MKIILVFMLIASTIVHAYPGRSLKHRILKVNPKPKVLRVKLPVWQPKEKRYIPERVDWTSVISGCRATCRYDKRLCNFYVRAAAHDSLSVSEGYGGADGSLLLTEDEIRRSENNYDNFAFLLSKNALALAKKYDASVADIIAVCGAVAVEFFGGPTIIQYDSAQPFLVGRHDRTEPNPANALAPANMNTTGFARFAQNKGLSLEEMTALMGSHTILDEKGCMKKDNTYCNPRISKCDDVLMYEWSNIYYRETCRGEITVNIPKALSKLPLPTREFLVRQDLCRFTSPMLKQRQENFIIQELPDNGDPDELVTGEDIEYKDVTWYDNDTLKEWPYTVHDAWMGKACQKTLPETPINNDISVFMNIFKNNHNEWNQVFTRAYKKMINTGAIWNKRGALSISGLECNSGYKSNLRNVNCFWCNFKNFRKEFMFNCHTTCKCKSAFKDDDIFYE